MTTSGSKRKSDMRWQQGRKLYDVVCPTLPSSSHVVVLMFCWFSASGPRCEFNVSHRQIADATRLSYERVRKIMSELTAAGVIATNTHSTGRGVTVKRHVTGKKYHPKAGHP